MKYVEVPQTKFVELFMKACKNIYLFGPCGCGKSLAAIYACEKNKWPYERFSLKKTTKNSDLIGGWIVKANSNGVMETVWSDGILARCVRQGKKLIADEFDYPQAGNITGLNYIMENNGKLVLDDKGGEIVEPAEGFSLVATGNSNGFGDTTGEYQGVQVMNQAMSDRFQAFIAFDYPTPAIEKKILMENFSNNLDEEDVDTFVGFSKMIRSKYAGAELSSNVSTRRLCQLVENIALFSEKGMTNKKEQVEVFRMSIQNKLPADEHGIVDEIIQRVFNADASEMTEKAEEQKETADV